MHLQTPGFKGATFNKDVSRFSFTCFQNKCPNLPDQDLYDTGLWKPPLYTEDRKFLVAALIYSFVVLSFKIVSFLSFMRLKVAYTLVLNIQANKI